MADGRPRAASAAALVPIWICSIPPSAWSVQVETPHDVGDVDVAGCPLPPRERMQLTLPGPDWFTARLRACGYTGQMPSPGGGPRAVCRSGRKHQPLSGKVVGLAALLPGCPLEDCLGTRWTREERLLHQYLLQPTDAYSVEVQFACAAPTELPVSRYVRTDHRKQVGDVFITSRYPLFEAFPGELDVLAEFARDKLLEWGMVRARRSLASRLVHSRV